MEKKFESELGKRIVEGKNRQSTINVGIIAAAVVSCALLVGSAAFLLPAMAGAETSAAVDYIELIDAEDDYLVYVEGLGLVHVADEPLDGIWDVKRTASLKQATFDSPSVMSDAQYNKFVYVLNVNLRDLTTFVPEGTVVGQLTIPYTGTSDPLVTQTMLVDGTLVAATPALVALVTDVDGNVVGISCEVALPDLDAAYAAGNMISIQIMMKVPLYTTISVDFTEIAFPASPDPTVVIDTPVEGTVVAPIEP
jgi:hypothetical protein